jgi:hypothetical protein
MRTPIDADARAAAVRRSAFDRVKDALRAEVASVQGLLAILMKRRNGGVWSQEDRIVLRTHLRRLGRRAPLLAVVALPGGSLLLPVLAYWLDRRKARRAARSAAIAAEDRLTAPE